MPSIFLAAEQAAHTEPALVIDLLVILATAGLVATLLQRLRMAVVPAYLIAGAIIGPNALSFVRSGENIEAISHLAIILLLFGIGLQLHLSTLRGNFKAYLLAGVGSCMATALVGWPVAMIFGLTPPAAMAVALALSMSSTAVVLRLFAQQREMSTPHGRLIFSILIIQDLLVLAMLAVMPALGLWAGVEASDGAEPQNTLTALLLRGVLMIAGVAVLIAVGRLLLPRLLREAARNRSSEVMIVLSLAAAIGAAVTTASLGFSAELGAFLAGFLLSATPFKHQLSGQIGPLRDFFIAVFFTAVGMTLDPAIVASDWWVLLLATAALFVIKAGVIGLACWSVGATTATAVLVGAALSQAGEFSLVVLSVAFNEGVVSDAIRGRVVAVVVVSLIVTPLVITSGRRLGRSLMGVRPAPWIRSSNLAVSPVHHGGERGDAERPRRVIIAGYGPVGRAVADRLEDEGVACTIIELNPTTVRMQTQLGRPIVFGDASNVEVLESAGVIDCDAVILTIPDDEAVLRACQAIRSVAPDVFIAARTDFLSQAMLASGFGADLVTVDEIATAEVMQREVLKRLSGPAIAASNDVDNS